MKVEIQGIMCYGEMNAEMNVQIVGTYPDGTEVEDIWCNDTEETNWTGVVRELKAYADREGFEIEELGSC